MTPTRKSERSFVAALRDMVSDMAVMANKCIMPIIRDGYVHDDGKAIEPFIGRFTKAVEDTKASYEYHGSEAARAVEAKAKAAPMSPVIPPPLPPHDDYGFPYGPAANDENPFSQQVRRVTNKHVIEAASESTEAVRYQINSAVGVDMGAMMTQEKIVDYVAASVADSVGLIKTIPNGFFSDINRVVLDGYRSGKSLSQISSDIQGIYEVHDFTAARIARDQMCKVTSDVTIKRMKDCGIERFRWSTSGDERVTGNPAGRYPKAKVKCYDIAKRDIGYGPGVYLISDGAEVNGEKGVYPGRAHIMDRCVAIALIAGIDYFPWDEK